MKTGDSFFRNPSWLDKPPERAYRYIRKHAKGLAAGGFAARTAN
jgi:hypothetical protein